MEWGDFLLDGLSRDPLPGKIFYGMGHLLNRYGEAYSAAPSDHRAETNLDNHLCLHQALITIWQKMRKMQLSAAIPELEPPRVEVLPAYRAAQPEPEEVEINGIIIGHEPGE